MSGSGKGGDNRKNKRQPFKRKGGKDGSRSSRDNQKGGGRQAVMSLAAEGKIERKWTGSLHERPKWVPPKPPDTPLPEASCYWCGKPVKDISAAISDPESGNPVHFDCVISRIAERENLESGDTISYIGGGRFGVVRHDPSNAKNFKIKKIFEWENKENRSEWRVVIGDYFSVT